MDEKKAIDYEALVFEMVNFLSKWGVWRDVSIFTDGKRYSSFPGKKYKNLINTECREVLNTEKYLEGPICSEIEGLKNIEWKSLSNPEHIFDMTFEGALSTLLRYGDYEVQKGDISKEAWDLIFENTDILSELLYEKYECSDIEDLLNRIIEERLGNSDYSSWDPLVFDTWEEYQVFKNGEPYPDGEEGLVPNYQRFGTYSEYIDCIEETEVMDVEDVIPILEKMKEEVKQEFLNDCMKKGDELIFIPEVATRIKEEFDSLFDKYGLWYENCFSWSLTCYKKEV